jgi:hypothetical protein
VGRLVTLWVALSAILSPVPPVLNGVVAAAFESPSDFGPPLAHLGDQLLNQFAFLRRDGLMIQGGFEVLVIPLTALLG